MRGAAFQLAADRASPLSHDLATPATSDLAWPEPRNSPTEQFEYFASCARGIENLLAAELRQLGARRLRPLMNGVAFFGDLSLGLAACLWLRTASRVLLILARVAASNADELYTSCRELAWEDHLAATGSLAIAAQGTNSALRNSQFVAQRVKDAIVDRLRTIYGQRPDVRRQRPDVLVNVQLHEQKATLAIDLSGEALHRRGYRQPSPAIAAPLRETLAAALVGSGGWTGLSNDQFAALQAVPGWSDCPASAQWPGNPTAPGWLVDPLCGSGTIVIEAAWIATDRAPGLLRDYWGFSGWLGHDPKLWQQLLDAADERAAAGLERLATLQPPLLLASDRDAQALAVAENSARRAGVAQLIRFEQQEATALSTTPWQVRGPGLLVTNPPYGHRLASAAQLPALYAELAQFLAQPEGPRAAAIITPDDQIESFLSNALGALPSQRIATMNGPLATQIRVWPLLASAAARPADRSSQPDQSGQVSQSSQADQQTRSDPPSQPTPSDLSVRQPVLASNAVPRSSSAPTRPVDAQEFTNRLAKLVRQRAKWARRNAISCYRLYDADLPDFNLAIDLYNGAEGTADAGQRWLHVAEYQAPAEVDPQLANARLVAALQSAMTVLDLNSEQVYLKRRLKAKGGSQYSASAADRASTATTGRHLVSEGGLLFAVDLASRLDTGLFLDQRLIRERLRTAATGQDCLNLFAYTGTASVYMAAGGARSVTSVDLSGPYLQWAQQNFALNQRALTAATSATGARLPLRAALYFEQADVLRWMAAKRAERSQPTGQPAAQPPARPGVQHTRSASPASSRTAPAGIPQRFGLIFVDVPTFSNSARMGSRTWDVQRDHPELLIAVSRLLQPGGQAIFCTNRRNFQPDLATLATARVLLQDISDETIPVDFQRNSKIHHCYLLQLVPASAAEAEGVVQVPH